MQISHSTRCALWMLFFLGVLIFGLFGIATMIQIGLSAPEKLSGFNKLLRDWQRIPGNEWITSTFVICSILSLIIGSVGFIASLLIRLFPAPSKKP